MRDIKKLKIAHVTSTFPPYTGGIGNVAYYLAKLLAEDDYRITVFTPRYKKEEEQFEGKFKLKRISPLIKYGNAALLPSLIRDLANFDLVHLHYPFFGGAESVYFLKKIFKKNLKLVLHYHMDVVGEKIKKFLFSFHTRYFLHRIVKIANIVIVPSFDYALNSNLSDYVKLYNEKFIDIPHGVDLDYFKPDKKDSQLIERYSIEDKKIILFVGSLDSAHYFKGVNYLIKAAEILKRDDFKIIIIGEGNLRPAYEELVKNKDLNDKVIFTGYLKDIRPFYNLADIFVLPSIDKSESFGLVLAEAMACQLPVVVSDLVGVRKLVEKNNNGFLVKPKDASSLAKTITILLDDDKLRIKLGRNGYEKVKNNYSWEIIVKKIENVYKSLITAKFE